MTKKDIREEFKDEVKLADTSTLLKRLSKIEEELSYYAISGRDNMMYLDEKQIIQAELIKRNAL